MTGYRLYLLNPEGHIVDAVEFYGDDDDVADAIAQEHTKGRASELWTGARVVRRYESSASET